MDFCNKKYKNSLQNRIVIFFGLKIWDFARIFQNDFKFDPGTDWVYLTICRNDLTDTIIFWRDLHLQIWSRKKGIKSCFENSTEKFQMKNFTDKIYMEKY